MGVFVTRRGVKTMIRTRIERAGSLRALAREWGVSPSYLSFVLHDKMAPGRKILDRLGLEVPDFYVMPTGAGKIGGG